MSTLTTLRANERAFTLAPSGNSGPSVAAGDGVDTFTQSLALTVESRLGIVGADDVAFLVNRQCANGGFGYVPMRRLRSVAATTEQTTIPQQWPSQPWSSPG